MFSCILALHLVSLLLTATLLLDQIEDEIGWRKVEVAIEVEVGKAGSVSDT